MFRKRKTRDFQAELDAHLAIEADELRSEGLTDAEARTAAQRTLGNRTSAEEQFYESTRWMFGLHLLRDLRFAARVLRKEPKFSVLVILGLGLGIGVSTALFAFVSASAHGHGTGFRPPDDILHPETFVGINRNDNFGDFSIREYRYLQEHAASVSSLTAESEPSSLVFGSPAASGEAEEVQARFESANFLAARGFHPALGRTFTAEEERAPIAILSHAFWLRRFGADENLIGQTVLLNNRPITIIGVTDPRFHRTDNAEIFLPLDLQSLLPSNLELIVDARLAPGAGLPQVRGEFQTLAASFAAANPGASLPGSNFPNQSSVRISAFLGDAPPQATRQRNEAIFALDAAIAMILLIACSNLASLLLARASARRRELGVRLSLGASRARLISQLLTESLLLAICGGLLGVLLSTWLAKWLLASVPYLDARANPQVLFYGLLLALVTGVSFGLGPALAVTRTNLAQALHSGGTPGTEPSTFEVGSHRNLLVVVPLALSLMLLIGAASVIRGVQSFGFVNASFDASRVVALAFRLKDQGYDDTKAAQFEQNLRERFSALPGVAGSAIIDASPFAGGSCQLQNSSLAGSYSVCHRVSPEFFAALNLPIRRGRPFTAADRAGSAPVAIVSQSFADKFFVGREAVGERIQTTRGTFDIVGVANDLSTGVGPIPFFPTVYIPATQESASLSGPGRGFDRMQLLVRSSGDPASVSAELRQIVRAADPSLWVSIQTVDDYLARLTNTARVAIFILGILGALVLLMAAAGIYALLAYSISRRTREIGIRVALGARNRELLLLVMRRTLILIAWGIGIGLLGALALGRILTSVVLRTQPPGAATCVSVALLLAGVSLLASYLPARKALRVNPVETLRCD